MSGWYEVSKHSSGQFRFVLKAANAETILTSELYATPQRCRWGHRRGAEEQPLGRAL